MLVTNCKVTLFSFLLFLITIGTAFAELPGKDDYVTDCARCHGLDGKGGLPAARSVPGYVAVDLTRLSAANGGQFPRQKVYDAIDGRKRFPAHLVGAMPTWGLKYRTDKEPLSPESEERVSRRISALVDYIESLQEK